MSLAPSELHIEHRAVGREVGEVLGLDAGAPVVTIERVLLANGRPAAVMFDVTHPAVELPATARLRRMLEGGRMVLDVLIEVGVPVAFARTHVTSRLLMPRERVAKALAIRQATAVLELEEIIYAGGGDPVAYSRDLFARGALDVTVMRFLDATSPTPIGAAGNAGRRARSAQLQG